MKTKSSTPGKTQSDALLAVIWLCLLFTHCISTSAQIASQPPVPEWINSPGGRPNQPVYFRKAFQARLPLLKAILLGACEGQMSIYLNGQVVGEIISQERATSLDVTKYIREGQNIIAIRASKPAGAPSLSLLLELNGDLARKNWVISDSTWSASAIETADWMNSGAELKGWLAARSSGRVDAHPETNPFDSNKAFDAYDSWKLALGTNAATDPATFTLRPGFKAELLRSAQGDEGSWISMAFDPQGRLTLAREKRGLIRLHLGDPHKLVVPKVDRVEVIEDTLLECRGLLYAHGALYVNANNSKGFYRLRDTQGNGQFDEVKLLLHTDGNVGHGRNHVVLGPQDWHLNHRLCVLLIYFQSPSVIGKTLDLLARAERPEDYMQYLFYLRYVKEGWTFPQREAYFRALELAEKKPGARDYYNVLKRVGDEVAASLSPTEQEALKSVLTRLWSRGKSVTNLPPAQVVREWRMDDFDLAPALRGRSFANGKAAFSKAQCILCHRFENEGGLVGPDLTAVGSRFDRRALLESILEPSKVIDEKFRNTLFVMNDGTTVTGSIEREDEVKVVVREGAFAEKPSELSKQTIARRERSDISPMPAGLVNGLQRDEILDLLGFLSSGGNKESAVFKP